MGLTSRSGRGWASATALVAVAIAGTFGAASEADATSIAYVDGGEVWVSTLDGKKKQKISAGEGDWREVAAADGGRMLGVRLEDGKIFQASKMQLWDDQGKVLSQGPLPYKNRPWSTYAAPVGLDLSADGVFATYGYSGYTGVVPSASFYRGHYVINADNKVLNVDLELEGEWPSFYGRRAVVTDGSVSYIQPDGTGPFGTDFTPMIDVSGTGLDLGRSDIAANGKLLAFDLSGSGAGTEKIGLVSINGVDPPVTIGTVDCFLPTVGDATHSTLSQDGTKVAWQDSQGVKVAPVPTTSADPCEFPSPPVVISATGKSPSIGGADISDVAPPPPSNDIEVKLPPKVKVGGLTSAGGVAVTVTAPAKGKVKVSGTVPKKKLGLKGKGRVTVVTGSAVASKAGPVKVKLHLVKKYRKYKSRLKGVTVRLTIAQGKASITRNVKLR